MTRTLVVSAIVLAFAGGSLTACGGGQKKQPVAKKPVKKKKKKVAKKAEPPPTPVSPQVAVSDELMEQCQLRINHIEKAPKFDYDRFSLLKEDQEVLDTVANCVKDGPLKGRSLILVGHTDDRGTVEYNLALGTKRASTVGEYLERQGVSPRQIGLTTRGEFDASGEQDDSRRVDRRVDIQLEREGADASGDALPTEEIKTSKN